LSRCANTAGAREASETAGEAVDTTADGLHAGQQTEGEQELCVSVTVTLQEINSILVQSVSPPSVQGKN